MIRRAAALAAALLLLATACAGTRQERVILAAGTTLVDGGFLDALVAEYLEVEPDADVSVVGDATAHVLELGRRRAADLLITHSPEAEEVFIAEGGSVADATVWVSRFLLVGPPEDVVALAGLEPADALAAIAAAGRTFVSRADGSGTHVKEQQLWAAAGVTPIGAGWYVETGQGMGLTLQVADQRDGFTLVELGTYLAAREALRVVPVDLAASNALENPYRAMVVRGGREGPARRLFDWLTSEPGRAVVRDVNLRIYGELVYVASP